ncbi:MAG TPA: PEP/pyruvate-binding domain-containing protein, partial [Myxococcaceae bacterium]|nr:PEP/pyruvate-binding domain-containing protein [Myxococcaceae bacterium]
MSRELEVRKRGKRIRRTKRTPARAKLVYHFDELPAAERVAGSWDEVRALLGGKGANLAEMTRLGLPVPPGFIVTTRACNAYLARGAFPQGLWEQILDALRALEKKTGKKLGDRENPLLLSCRSGAKFSMPGMMDTVLNIGLNREVAESLARLTGDERFAWDAYRRLIQMFATVVMGVEDEPFEKPLAEHRKRRGVANDADLPAEDLRALVEEFERIVEQHAGRPFPSDPTQQLRLAIEAVFRSWNGKRAFDYRKAAGIPHDLGTAVNIVTMVFGDLGAESGTGVATTRNVSTGE